MSEKQFEQKENSSEQEEQKVVNEDATNLQTENDKSSEDSDDTANMADEQNDVQ